jgi:hypothetical protein
MTVVLRIPFNYAFLFGAFACARTCPYGFDRHGEQCVLAGEAVSGAGGDADDGDRTDAVSSGGRGGSGGRAGASGSSCEKERKSLAKNATARMVRASAPRRMSGSLPSSPAQRRLALWFAAKSQ